MSPDNPTRKQRITPSTIAIVALLVLVALMGWALLRRPAPVATPALAAADAAVVAPAPAPRNASARPARDLLPPEAHMSPEELKDYHQSRFSAFETRYREDSVDPAWAAETEKKMLDAAAEPALNEFGAPDTYDADCHAHLCKIVMTFDTKSHAEDWEQFYVTGLGGSVTRVASSTQVQPDGKVSLLIYGTRGSSERMLDFPPPAGRSNAGPTADPGG